MINSTIQNGLTGMQAAYQGMTQSATDIARFNSRNSNSAADINDAVTGFAQPLFDLHLQQTLFDASAHVVETSDAMVGSLLDVTV